MIQPAPGHARVMSARRLLSMVLLTALVATAFGVAAVRPAAAGTPDRAEQLRFMWAMSGQESGGDYYARNSSSGAFGKYQIMPFNWPGWAGKYLGNARADQTPYNQEKVAYGKLRDLHGWLGGWRRVAYWWLTGSSEPDESKWSSYAKGYVDNIMRLRNKAPDPGVKMPPKTSSRASKGDWRRSGQAQKLRLSVGGRTWPKRGALRDGQVLKVRAVKTSGDGEHWIRVVTLDGRLGWLQQLRTVPALKPSAAGRWSDVRDRGKSPEPNHRKHVRPRPR